MLENSINPIIVLELAFGVVLMLESFAVGYYLFQMKNPIARRLSFTFFALNIAVAIGSIYAVMIASVPHWLRLLQLIVVDASYLPILFFLMPRAMKDDGDDNGNDDDGNDMDL